MAKISLTKKTYDSQARGKVFADTFKAFWEYRELINSNSAVDLVTHDLKAVKEMAHKALWIDHGKAMKYGDVDSVIDAYLNA